MLYQTLKQQLWVDPSSGQKRSGETSWRKNRSDGPKQQSILRILALLTGPPPSASPEALAEDPELHALYEFVNWYCKVDDVACLSLHRRLSGRD